MRTRAMACLRRPVAAPGPEAAGLRASTTGVSDSLVYSVSSCSCSSPWTTSVCSAEVVSATVLLVSSVCSDACACNTSVSQPWRAEELLRDLRDLKWHGLLRLVRVHVSGVDLQLAQLLASQGALGEHATNGLLDSLRGLLGQQVLVGGRPQACLLYTSPSPRDRTRSRMPSSA